ncbi:beta-N-acetylglucosaminidase domain-containing protein [Mycoplasma elephantis]|uniref:beta-N-acetylglucosaminidase domain-containing protein n=1 Tax=Mycoplasma elephantis TaxID=114882 RepID=UPI000485697F|nr:beta-N-acetylglucosaminidase domain-containing protein [Mycoplasma elephantis]
MKNKFILKTLLALAPIVSVASFSSMNFKIGNVNDFAFNKFIKYISDDDKYISKKRYEIFPKPFGFVEFYGSYFMTEEIDLCYENKNLDSNILSFIKKTLEANNIKISNPNNKNRRITTNTKISIGFVDGDDDISLSIKNKHIDVMPTPFEFWSEIHKNDWYSIYSNNNEISIMVKNKQALFFAFSTLSWIFDDLIGRNIRNFFITDSANSKFRAFTEGDKKFSWTLEELKSLFEFGIKYKLNSYIYGTDDIYCTNKWNELYSEDKIEEIKKIIEAANENGINFTWIMNPWSLNKEGKNNKIIDLNNNYEESLNILKNKFQQLYDAGARQFGIDFSLSNENVNNVSKIMDELWQWGKNEGRNITQWILIPNLNDANKNSFDVLREYQKNIQLKDIFIKTDAISPFVPSDETIDFYNNKFIIPFNWPTNIYDRSTLHLSWLEEIPFVNTTLPGYVLKCMDEAEASKIAMAIIGSLMWNNVDLDPKNIYLDTIAKIEPSIKQLFSTLNHISSTRIWDKEKNEFVVPNIKNGLTTNSESYSIQHKYKGSIELLKNSFNEIIINEILSEVDAIQSSISLLNTLSKNKKFLKELEPYLLNLNYLAKSMQHALLVFKDIDLNLAEKVKIEQLTPSSIHNLILTKKYLDYYENLLGPEVTYFDLKT